MSHGLIEFEATARECSESIINQYKDDIPESLRIFIGELLTDAVHDGIEVGISLEAVSVDYAQEVDSDLRAKYREGFMDGYQVATGDVL